MRLNQQRLSQDCVQVWRGRRSPGNYLSFEGVKKEIDNSRPILLNNDFEPELAVGWKYILHDELIPGPVVVGNVVPDSHIHVESLILHTAQAYLSDEVVRL